MTSAVGNLCTLLSTGLLAVAAPAPAEGPATLATCDVRERAGRETGDGRRRVAAVLRDAGRRA